jgi:hypothetical protein
MKKITTLSLTVTATLGMAALAVELQKATVENSKAEPQLVAVFSGKQVVAELKIMKEATLNVEAGEIFWRVDPKSGGKTYNRKGGSKMELSVESKVGCNAVG